MPVATSTFAPVHHLVAFAKIQVNKTAPHITLTNDTIYFGGITASEDEAHKLARALVNATPPATRAHVIPRVFPMPSPELFPALCDAQEAFEMIIARMNETAEAVL